VSQGAKRIATHRAGSLARWRLRGTCGGAETLINYFDFQRVNAGILPNCLLVAVAALPRIFQQWYFSVEPLRPN